jgi:cellulose synthase/poly-beta-1,6-N-acetylglucosamine synthase-like glycosyltransferase
MSRKLVPQDLVRPRDDGVEYNRHCAVAIPVKDEAVRLPRCLRALASQRDKLKRSLPTESFRVVIFANNCTDNSAKVARSMSAHLSMPVLVVEAALPPAEAHAGNARRAAMDMAETWLMERGPGGVILTTDADSEVPADWVANNLAAVDSGADAVLGHIALDEEGELLPEALHRRGCLEGAYETLLTELSSLLDPIASNPWPHHATISGASLAVTVEAYRRVGRLPRVPLGEDKALVAELLRHDARIRFSPDIQVVTSGRVNGRAPGGVADTLRFRSRDPEAYCDEALEPSHTAIARARSRRWLRVLRQSGELSETGEWRVFLGVSRECARRAVHATNFGAAWSIVEAGSSLLQRRLLRPADLPDEIAGARRALVRLREQELSARDNVEPKQIVAVPSNDLGDRIDEIDEEFGGLVTA